MSKTAEPDFSRSPFRKVHVAPPEQLRAAWDLLSWQARGLHRLLLTEANREGFLDLGTVGLVAVCAFIRAARADWPGIEPGLRELIDGGWLLHDPEAATLTIAWYQLSQKTPTAEALRKQAYRERVEPDQAVSHGCPNVPGQQDECPSGVPLSQPKRTRIENREKRKENTTADPPKSPQGQDGDLQAKPKADPEDIGRNAWDAIQLAAGGPKALGLDRCYGSDPSCWLEDSRLSAWVQTWKRLRAAVPPMTLADCEKLGRWIFCGGAGKISAPWQLLAKPGGHANVGAWFAASGRWDGVSDPAKWPSARAPKAHADSSMVHPDDAAALRRMS